MRRGLNDFGENKETLWVRHLDLHRGKNGGKIIVCFLVRPGIGGSIGRAPDSRSKSLWFDTRQLPHGAGD